MCGIAGIFSNQPIPGEIIQWMTQSIKHRGPDAEGIYRSPDSRIALGHVRLSIIDLSPSANQPMHSRDGRLTISFNGEIYNFKEVRQELRTTNGAIQFVTHSDTETILHAFAQWGPAMVNKLEGMFAMAIYDHKKNSLYIFRDRLGKKPLFYYQDKDHFIFASEIKAMRTHPIVRANAKINQDAIHRFLHLGYIPQPDTIFRSIKKFPAGHWASKKCDTDLELHEYWNFNQVTTGRVFSENTQSIKDDLRLLLDDSVQKRLISDVPVGTFLSGGTDSSLITAIATRHHPGKLKTFSIGFRESKYDESRYAEQVAKQLGTDHHAHTLEESQAIDILETYLQHFDEPFADTSAIPTMLVSQLTRKHVTVALTGDGGDELFHGYGAYSWARRLDNPVVQIFQTPTSGLLKIFGNDRLKRIGKMLERVTETKRYSHVFSQEQYFFSDTELKDLLVELDEYISFTWNPGQTGLSPGEEQALFDLNFYLRDDLLVKVDRASMYHALECRCPLLDHHLVEFAVNLSEKYKVSQGERKWILKELLKEYLPEDLIYRPKWGFSIPLPKWLNGELSYLIDDFLNRNIVQEFNLVRYQIVHDLVQRFRAGEQHLYNRLWVLIVLHKWMKTNG